MSQPVPSNSNPVLDYYTQWSSKTPYVTRISIIIIVIVCIFSFLIFDADQYLGNIPLYTILDLELYRILFSPLVGNSVLNLLFILLFFPEMSTRLEYTMGSLAYLSLICTLSIIINITFIIICFILSFMGLPYILLASCSGFWTIIFAFITIECMRNPDEPRQLFCFPLQISSKYFPLVLYVVFCLFSGPVLSFAVSIFVGYLQSQGYFDKLRPSSYSLEQLESTGHFFHSISRNSGWCLAAGLGHDSWAPVNQNGADWGNQQTTSLMNPMRNSSESNKEFPGSGMTLANSSNSQTVVSKSNNTQGMTREAVAARRIAALAQQSTKSTSDQTTTTISNEALQSLLEMGFDKDQARNALISSNGDTSLALQILTSQ